MGRYSFEGDEIETHNSARGLEISVTLDRVSHLRTYTLTVFLPDLELEDMTDEMSFQTVGIHSSRRRAMTTKVGAALTSEPHRVRGPRAQHRVPGLGPDRPAVAGAAGAPATRPAASRSAGSCTDVETGATKMNPQPHE